MIELIQFYIITLTIMCGIFGYIGKNNATEEIWEGLKRLEYRGYDSWGVAVIEEGKIKVSKKVGAIGSLDELKNLPVSHIGIGHTRWATHGGVTRLNAHPHYSADKSFVLAQNGIVENYQELKKELVSKGHKFESETDTEVIVRLIEEKQKETDDLRIAVRKAFLDLKGRNTVIILSSSGDKVVAVRNGSPLVVGVVENNNSYDEFYFASDTLSFANKTDKVVYVNDNEMVYVENKQLKVFDVKTDRPIDLHIMQIDCENTKIDKEGFDHFMIKEIVEQKYTLMEALQYSYDELKELIEYIKTADSVYMVGAGTASYAAGQIGYYLRKISKIRAFELKSYEIGSYVDIIGKNDLVFAISQSGETADTIEAVEYAKSRGAKVASLVNMMGSTLTRMSDYKFFSRSGPEICVASTKAFTSQIAWGYLLAKSIMNESEKAKDEVLRISSWLNEFLCEETFTKIKSLVRVLKDKEHFFILGKGQNYYISLEGALKIKEITYKHFEGFAAGELKHGVIALIDKGTPVFVIVSNDENMHDMISAAAEVKARGAYVIAISDKKNELFDFTIQTTDGGDADSIVNVIPFQLISYFLGIELGNDPDKPRNLAKSVTVK